MKRFMLILILASGVQFLCAQVNSSDVLQSGIWHVQSVESDSVVVDLTQSAITYSFQSNGKCEIKEDGITTPCNWTLLTDDQISITEGNEISNFTIISISSEELKMSIIGDDRGLYYLTMTK